MSVAPLGSPGAFDPLSFDWDADPSVPDDFIGPQLPPMSEPSTRSGPSALDVLAQLQAAKGEGPGLLGFLDSDKNVRKLAQQLGSDGRLNADDVVKLLTAAKDFQQITDAERKVLRDALHGEYGALEPAARQAFAQVLGVDDPGLLVRGRYPGLVTSLGRNPALEKVLKGEQQLQTGARGAAVADLQHVLKDLGYPLEVTAVFDQATAKAISGFQRQSLLPATGALDQRTLRSLNEAAYLRTPGTGDVPPDSAVMARVLQYKDEILAASKKHGVPPELIAAIMDNESDGVPDALSFDGGHGKGLMQIDDRSHAFAKTSRVFDPAANIDYGAGVIATNMRIFGTNLRAAIAAYNAGAGGVKRVLAKGLDPSKACYHPTYVRDALAQMERYRPYFQ